MEVDDTAQKETDPNASAPKDLFEAMNLLERPLALTHVWIPSARIERATINASGQSIELRHIVWRDLSLELEAIYADRPESPASIAAELGTQTVSFTAAIPNEALSWQGQLEVGSETKATVINEIAYQENRLTLEADFGAGSWLPQRAEWRADSWQINGEEFGLDILYTDFGFDFSGSINKPYSRFLRQDIVRTLRNLYHAHGYPEVSITSSTNQNKVAEDRVDVELVLTVTPGPLVTVSGISFEGSERTKPRILESRLAIRPGDPLDPGKLDQSRLSLSRIGIFNKVAYEEIGEGEDARSIRFLLSERPIWNADALLGLGSYEQARVGFEEERINVLGLGHRARLRSIVSIKSALGEWRYLIPEIFGSRTSVSTKLFALDREEVSFDRVEFGFVVAASRRSEKWDLDADAVYTFQSLEAQNIQSPEDVGLEDANAGSVELRLGRDRRDNPLNPKKGYRFFGHFEYAAEFMGGEVDYQRQEIGISWHGSLSHGLYWHLGLTHGAIGSFAEAQRPVPFVKLFFPGGENSIRGYQRGEVAPAANEGNILGARSYALVNLELEQMLNESLSAILFFDGLGATANIDDYPFDETRASVGLGLRMKTFMGPVRLGYGANLDRRSFDPSGTVHFSLGYPF